MNKKQTFNPQDSCIGYCMINFSNTLSLGKDERFKAILHQYDVWHVAKSLTKKLAAVSQVIQVYMAVI